MKTLLYFGPSGIGDWCFIWPSIPALLKQEGCDQLHIVIPYENPGNRLLKNHPLVSSITYLERQASALGLIKYGLRWLRILLTFRRKHFPVLAVSYLSNQADFLALAALSGIPKRIGRPEQTSLLKRFAYTKSIETPSSLGKVHIHAAYIDLNKQTQNTPSDSLFPNIEPLGKDHADWPSGYICLAIGGGRNARWRFWPAEHYRDLILTNPDKHFILLGGGPDDLQQAQIIMREPTPANVTDKVDQINMDTALSIIKSATAMVGNDTGLTNISTVLKTPTLTIYGPSDPTLTGPALLGSAVIVHKVSCSPCFGDKQDARMARTCPHHLCLSSVDVMSTSIKLKKILLQH